MNKCAPGKKFTNGSCFTTNDLVKMASHYNKKYTDKIDIIEDKKYLLKELTRRMKQKYNCNDDICWIETKFIKSMNDEDILYDTFRPTGPKKQYEWLSTTDIDKVMYQYESKYPEFKFLGALPYDFEELPYFGIQNIDFDKLKDTTYKIGAVINLDEHNMPGSHWVALYANLRKNIVYYFDSFGKKPGKRINIFVRKILNYMYNVKYHTNIKMSEFMSKFHSSNDYDVRYNKIQHQFKNSECGVYSMNFIIRLLGGETFDDIVNNITDDTTMNNCRKIYFRNY
jgi:hypothetical protein